MFSIIQKIVDYLTKPSAKDQERIDRWRAELNRKDSLDKLHRKSRAHLKKGKKEKQVTYNF